MTQTNPTGLDAYTPAEIARLVQNAGVAKAELTIVQTMALAVLAGVFIGFGAAGFTLTMTGADPAHGPSRLLAGVVFSSGLILVLLAGAELFTGNALMTMAAVERRITVRALMRNWGLVLAGNALGSVVLALAMAATGLLDGPAGAVAVRIAETRPRWLRARPSRGACSATCWSASRSGSRCRRG